VPTRVHHDEVSCQLYCECLAIINSSSLLFVLVYYCSCICGGGGGRQCSIIV